MEQLEAIVKRRILAITALIAAMQGVLWSGPGAVQAAQVSDTLTISIQLGDQFPPKPITDLLAGSPAEYNVNLAWTAPSEDNLITPSVTAVTEYDLRMATFSVVNGDTTTWWNSAQNPGNEPSTPNLPGQPEFMTIGSLEAGGTYYFAIRSRDEVPNQWSPVDDLALSSATQAKVIVKDDPPPAPANLNATPGSGEVTLSWDAVTAADLDYYRIYMDSTEPYADAFTPIGTSTTTTFLHGSLVNGASYYYYVTAVDRGAPYNGFALESSSSNVAFAVPMSNLPPEAPLISVDLTALTTSQIRWILRDNAVNEAALYVSLSTQVAGRLSPNLGPLPGVSASVAFTEQGLTPNRLYARYGEAYNLNGSSWSLPASIYTLANPPKNTTVIGVSTSTVSLTWNANGNFDPTFYEVEYANDASFNEPKSAGGTVTTNFTVFNLESNTNYWFRVRARNGDNKYTVYDVTVSTKTLRIRDSVPPKSPTPIWAEWMRLEPTAELNIHWREVVQNVDGTPFDDPAPERYKIYRSRTRALDVNNPAEKIWSVGETGGQAEDTSIHSTLDVLAASDVYYYRVRAVDMWGNESPDSYILEAKGDGTILNVQTATMDPISHLSIPVSLVKVLLRENNSYGDDLLIRVNQVTEEEKGRTVRSVRFDVFKASSGQAIDGFAFKEGPAYVRVGYQVANGQVIQGSPSVDGSLAPTGAPVVEATRARESLSLFWHNGVEWVKVGGIVDPVNQQVQLRTSRVGRYQVRLAIHIGPVSLTRVYPRIFTPNGDGWNDKVIFQFDNPAMVALSGEIFDVTGAKVADLVPGAAPDSELQWDGKRSGTPVPSGVYIYQISAGGETATGTVVVAE